MTTTSARQALHDQLYRRELVVAVGVFDGISAHVARSTGQAAAYLTGAGVAASGFGLPDVGLVTQTEMAERARMIAGVLGDIPLIADADTGYGAPINVVRTVRQYETAGVAAIQLEDQEFPKRCGHLTGKRVVDTAVFEQILAAALDSRVDEKFLVIARTDARAPDGLDEAIQRANSYAQAGADIVFVEAPQGVDETERIAREIEAPLLINLVAGGLTPHESASRLKELGYAIAIYPGDALIKATAAMVAAMCELSGANPADYALNTPVDLFNLLGMAEWAEIDRRYANHEASSWD